MTRQLVMALATLGVTAALGAYPGAAQTPTPSPTPSPKILTITGCISGATTEADRFTLTDSKEGTTYRLSGATVRRYAGQRVQITGGVVESKRLHVAGGLVPSPNVAGQAGAIDPVQAAMAGSTSGTGPGPLPTFRVTRVRPLTGSCPER